MSRIHLERTDRQPERVDERTQQIEVRAQGDFTLVRVDNDEDDDGDD